MNGNKIKIEDLYEMFSEFVQKDDNGRNYVKPVTGIATKSFNTSTEKVEDKQIKYVMKHKVSKEMFKITTEDGNSVIVTEDHSVIVNRNGEYISVCPRDIDVENDKVINIVSDNYPYHYNATTK